MNENIFMKSLRIPVFKKVFFCSVGVLALAMPSVLFANPGTWTPVPKKISGIIVEGTDSGNALVLIEGGVPPEYIPSECRSGGNAAYNTIPLNTDKGRGMYSLALAAYFAQKPILLAVQCAGTRPLITHMQVL
jgi:hypothetical protein